MSRIDYNLKKIRGVVFDVDGVLSPSTIPMNEKGVPQRMVNIKDGFAMQLAVKRGLRLAIITGADTPGIISRYNALGITDVFLKAAHKSPVLKRWAEDHELAMGEIAYVGDDVPDLPALREAGLAVAPRDAVPDVRQAAVYISPVDGGYGVARDLLEQILRAQGLWLTDAEAFGW